MSIKQNQSDQDDKYGGEMFIGGSNPNFYHGDLHYVNIIRDADWGFIIDR